MRLASLMVILALLFLKETSATSIILPNPYDSTHLKISIPVLKIKDLERLAGRKFTIKEKLQIKILQLSYKKQRSKKLTAFNETDKPGNLAFIAALAALALTLLGVTAFNTVLPDIISILLLAGIPLLSIIAGWLGIKSIRNNGKNFKNMFAVITGGAIIIIAIIVAIGALTL